MKTLFLTALFALTGLFSYSQQVSGVYDEKKQEEMRMNASSHTYSYLQFTSTAAINNGVIGDEIVEASGKTSLMELSEKSTNAMERKMAEVIQQNHNSSSIDLLNQLGRYGYKLISVVPITEVKSLKRVYLVMREQ